MATGNQPEKVACPHCGAMIKSLGLAAGAGVNCPKCGKAFRVGDDSGEKDEGRRTSDEGQKAGSQRPGTRTVQSPPPPVGEAKSRRAQPRSTGAAQSTEYSVPSTPSSAATNQDPAATRQSAIRNQQVRSRPPDGLVDPNLLAPPPPRVKPKAKEVAVVCRLCGTRNYAPLEKIGQEIKCPDCHTTNVVPALPDEGAKKKPSGPTLEDVEEYAMSEEVERPKYRPLQAARGEYEVLSALDPATMEHRVTAPGEGQESGARGQESGARSQESGVRGQEPRRDSGQPKPRVTVEPVDDEVVLEPEVERVQVAPDPRAILPQPEMEPENALYDGKYDDGLLGDQVDPRSPDAWKRAPLVYGIVGFLFYSSTLLRWAVFAAGLAGVATLVKLNWSLATSEEGQNKVLAVFLIQIAIPAGAVWLIAFASAALAIVQGTGNGEQEIESWPDWNPLEWFGNAMYILLALLAAGLPGSILAGATLAASVDDPGMAAFGVAGPLALSLMILFPFILYSMLTEDSFFAVFSSQVVRTFSVAGDGWLFFYMYSILIFLFGGMALGLTIVVDNLLVRALASVAVVALMLIYLRLLGRLMWFANDRLAKSG